MVRFGLVLSLIALLAGCSGRGSGLFVFTEVSLHQTGGIAGFDRQMRVAADGTYQVFERGTLVRKGTLSARDRNRLSQALARVDWAALRPEYHDPRVADAIREQVIVRTPSQQYVVEVGTGGSPPAALAEALRLLGELMSQALVNTERK